jgi:antitoxin (DNA-binding transcriptional repressor) of toxin-antitoxin stability system
MRGKSEGGQMGRVEVSNEELRSVRDATRELGRLVDSLESGDAEKFVLTKHGQMRAVVVSLDEFTAMRACQRASGLSDAA